MKIIGIECESIEGKNPTWGIGKIILRLLEEISHRPELEQKYRFILYFKDKVPEFTFLNSPIFEKKITPVPFIKNRLFPIYYFALLPMRLWFERLNVMFWPNYMLPVIAFGKSIVLLTEDVYYEAHDGKLPFRYRLAYRIFGWWTAKFATKIIAISKTSKKNLIKLYGIKSERIVVNYLGIDKLDTKHETRNTKQIQDSYLLFVGQMFPRRHAKETILAFEKLAPEFPDLKLVAIGPDKYPKPTINSLAEEINKKLNREAIIHKDYVNNSELAELYTNAQALIYVSDREAFGLPPMEALSFGIPPIIIDNELGHELFGEYAFYSKSGGTDDIIETIRKVLNEPSPSTALRASRLELVKKYSWKNFTEKFLEIINS